MYAKTLGILHAAQLELNALDAERAINNDDALHPNDFRSRLLVAGGWWLVAGGWWLVADG